MQAMDDVELLRKYATGNSETAFETLVSRYVRFVYSAALRQVRDPHLAEEVSQAVFIILAQKAGKIHERTLLSGWLFKTTRFVALAQARAATRRHQYEKEAQLQSEVQPIAPDALWQQMSPLLDEALAQLGPKDRQAVLLRFFENKSLAEVGNFLGTGEDTARMRISRALEKLRKHFLKRGVVSTTAIIAGAISANSLHAAPAALAKSITTVAMTKGVAASGSTLTLIKGALKLMAWTKAKTAIVTSAIVLLAAGTATLGVMKIKEHRMPVGQEKNGGAVEMKNKWEIGKKYVMNMEIDHVDMPINQQVKFTQDFEISVLKNLDNGGWELELRFGNQTLNVRQRDREVLSFDSMQSPAQDATNPAAPILRAIAGARLQYFTDDSGQVEKVEGDDDLENRIAAAENTRQPGTLEQILQGVFAQIFSKGNLKEYVSFGEMMPDYPVKLGDSWPFSKDVDTAIGTLVVNEKYTFKDWEQRDGHKCAHLESTGDISIKSPSAVMGAVVAIQKGKITGEEWFDPELGRITDANSDEDMTLKITMRQQILTEQLNEKIRRKLLEVTP
jgi:RNA polymerase sigma factor (sigma-70 family)